MSSEDPAKPKLIIDDDWKTRVEAEKEQLRQQPGTESQGPGSIGPGSMGSGSKGPESKGPEPEIQDELPPASFSTLVSTLVTQALTCLGQIPDPVTNQPVFHPDTAKYLIDTLDVLQQKTKGNLTNSESAMLTNVLHELRMAFVAITSRQKV